MVFLFSLINISFTLFFFLFWQYLESVLFWLLSVIFIIYFSKILSFFIKKEETEWEKINNSQSLKLPLKKIMELSKKWSYYIAFLWFYSSLYGFIYGINLIYNFSDFSDIFHYISLFITLIITGIFYLFQEKKSETISLIFRSNCIIFTVIYFSFLVSFLFRNIQPNITFIINSIFPIITLISVLLFDPYLKEKGRIIYPIFLLYLFSIIEYYSSLLFPNILSWNIFFGMIAFFMIIYTFVFPKIKYFFIYRNISQTVGVIMGIMLFSIIFVLMIFYPPSFFYFSLLCIIILYHYWVYYFLSKRTSYIFSLLACIFLYIEIFLLLESNSFITYLLFIFILPYLFIGADFIFYIKKMKERYILHFMGLSFSIFSLIYYFVQIGSVRDILVLSTLLFFESILMFLSYIRLKK